MVHQQLGRPTADGQGSTPPCVLALADSLPAELVTGASSPSSAPYPLANRELERSLLAKELGGRKERLPNWIEYEMMDGDGLGTGRWWSTGR